VFEVYAAVKPIPVSHRGKIIGLKFSTKAEALDRACHLRRQGWSVYRVTGPGGFEMIEESIDQHCRSQHPK
jgi:hypothetical protein